MTVFLVIGAIGLLLLLASLVFGDVLEIPDFFISTTAFGAALTGFGAIGLIVSNDALRFLLATVAAVALGALVQLVITRARSSEVSSIGYDLVGALGTLTATTGPSSGEVRLDDSREIETRLAYSEDWLEPGARVEVVALDGSRVEVRAVDRSR
ncbi:hypothetical protein C8046_13505 [Serinibacter arcticus]|uniref:Uncharacterized protein n=2 Tax=Serinibacter arcticus TaxID=1655435 RepID=A0A2U1ZX77_9MICO|nr:hypothetical protein C8046_13505 [Serinibacter arcticus]